MVDLVDDRKVLTHLLDKVLVLDEDAPIVLTLKKAGVQRASDFVSLQLTPDTPLKYDRPAEGSNKVKKNVPLLVAETRQIMGLEEYIRYYAKNVFHKVYESIDDWEKLTAKDFVLFRINIAPTLPPDVAPSAAPTQPPPVTNDPLKDWKKGIKRDMSIFKELKRVKDWDQWDTQFRADVATQGLSRVLDNTFVPKTYEDRTLFQQQQYYLYAVFVRVLKTDKGKAIVRKYKSTFDAQSIYKDLQEYATNSTQAVIDSNTLLQYITTARIDDGSWNGMTEQFVLHWMEQVRLYEDLVDPDATLVDAVKLTLIPNAVRGHPKLSGVHNVAIQLASHTGQRVDYDQYSDLLLSECAQVDSAFAQSSPKTSKRSVYMSDLSINDGEVDALHDDGEACNIDSDPVTLMANAHRCRMLSANHVLMVLDQWKGLSPEGQKTWDQLSEEDKAIILKKSTTGSSKPTRPFNKRTPTSQKANVHDTSVYDFIVANSHLLDYGETTGDTEADTTADDNEVDDSHDNDAQTLHAFLVSRGDNSSPADIRNMLSTLSKHMPAKQTKDRQANAHVTYMVDKHHMDKPGSLIDRGANGGVAGADVRVFATTDHAVNVQGISEHQVTDLKIVSAGGIVQTQKGPVIAIFNQYAHIGTGKTIHSSIQLEEFGLKVNEKSVQVPGGLQRIETPDGYVHPIRIKDGLPYVALRPYTDEEWKTLPHVHWTRDSDWDPAIFDHEFDDNDEWYDAVMNQGNLFDDVGNYRHRQGVVAAEHISAPTDSLQSYVDEGTVVDICVTHLHRIEVNESQLHYQAHQVKPGEHDWETLCRFFGWASAELIEKTFLATTQMGRLSNAIHLKKQYRSPNPADLECPLP